MKSSELSCDLYWSRQQSWLFQGQTADWHRYWCSPGACLVVWCGIFHVLFLQLRTHRRSAASAEAMTSRSDDVARFRGRCRLCACNRQWNWHLSSRSFRGAAAAILPTIPRPSPPAIFSLRRRIATRSAVDVVRRTTDAQRHDVVADPKRTLPCRRHGRPPSTPAGSARFNFRSCRGVPVEGAARRRCGESLSAIISRDVVL